MHPLKARPFDRSQFSLCGRCTVALTQMIESSLIREERLVGHIDGYPSTIAPEIAIAYDSITSAYAESQLTDNIQKTDRYLFPLVQRTGARTVLDAGCGLAQRPSGCASKVLTRMGLTSLKT